VPSTAPLPRRCGAPRLCASPRPAASRRSRCDEVHGRAGELRAPAGGLHGVHRAPATPVRRRRLGRALAALLVVALAAAGCGDDDRASGPYAGIVREPAPLVGSRSLPDATTGAPVSFRARPGGLLLVYFGYLSCPDVCPTTMADLRTALGSLRPAERERVATVMATIDPGRDDAAALSAYVDAFVAGGGALRTDDQAALRAATDAFGADYRVTTTADGRVEVSHTGFVYAVDDQGRLRLTWPFGTRSTDIGRDLVRLLARLDDAA
jgi:protein SCO1/2